MKDFINFLKKLHNKYLEYFIKNNINIYYEYFIAYDFGAINKRIEIKKQQ